MNFLLNSSNHRQILQMKRMKKTKTEIGIVLLPLITLILELLPFGAVLIFAPSPTESIRKTYSYFSMKLLGYANFSPFATALLTCLILISGIRIFLKSSAKVLKILFTLSIVAVIISLIPLMSGFEYYSVTGAVITALLISETILAKIFMNLTP